jgi:choline dehydrogenase-like flavoprotein
LLILLEAGGEPDANPAPDGWRLGKPADWGYVRTRAVKWREPVAARAAAGRNLVADPLRGARRGGRLRCLAARGNPGWAWADVLPAFRRLETDLDFGDEPGHGSSGPVPVTRYPDVARSETHVATVEAFRQSGFADVADHIDGVSGGKRDPWRIAGIRGSKSDRAAHCGRAPGRAAAALTERLDPSKLAAIPD